MSPKLIQTFRFIFPLIRQTRSCPSWHFTKIRSKPSSLTAVPNKSLAAGNCMLLMSSSLITFRLPIFLTYLNYLILLLYVCCLRMFSFQFSSSMCNAVLQMIDIFYSWSPNPLLDYTFTFTSLIYFEKVQLFSRTSLRYKRKLFKYGSSSALIKA